MKNYLIWPVFVALGIIFYNVYASHRPCGSVLGEASCELGEWEISFMGVQSIGVYFLFLYFLKFFWPPAKVFAANYTLILSAILSLIVVFGGIVTNNEFLESLSAPFIAITFLTFGVAEVFHQ